MSGIVGCPHNRSIRPCSSTPELRFGRRNRFLYFCCSMWAICKKEFRQFFSNLTGYITIILFLLLNGLFLFVFSSFNILDYGYATLENFFNLSPYILLLLIPAVTMRLFPDEWRSGTMETLFTRPLTAWQIVWSQ